MEAVSKDFDLVVHQRDKRTGQVTGSNPYRCHVRGDIKIFERKGAFYFQNGDAVDADIVTYVLGYDPAKGPVEAKEPDVITRARASMAMSKLRSAELPNAEVKESPKKVETKASTK